MSSLELKVNYTRAAEISVALVKMLHEKVHPFNQENLFPDAIVPEKVAPGSLEHSQFIFYGCSLDSMMVADLVYSGMRGISQDVGVSRLWELDKDQIEEVLEKNFRDPKHVEKKSQRLLFNLGGKKKENRPYNDASKTIRTNSKLLHEKYEDDPRKLISEKGNEQERIAQTLNNIQEFWQYGIGKASLLMKNYVRFGIWDFDPTKIPIKVDRWALRISVGSGVIELPKELTEVRTDKILRPLLRVYSEVCQRERISAIDLNDAIWAFGSKICKSKNRSYCNMYCPAKCKIRPKSDNRAMIFYLDKETRKDHPGSLF